MELKTLVFESDKGPISINNVFLFTKDMVIFNVEKVEETLIDGTMGDTGSLKINDKEGKLVDTSTFCKLDSFVLNGNKVIIEKDFSEGSIADKKIKEFCAIVPTGNDIN